jgi:hypothetical protein
MKKLLLTFSVAALVAGTAAAGWLHGRMTNRWGRHPDSNLAAARLRQPLPDRVGHWRLRREAELEPAVIRLLQCPAFVSRVYEHEQTGDAVSVAVLLGPPGPISVHTPEICYSSQDFTLTSEREARSISDVSGTEHSLWQVSFKSNGVDGTRLRVLYGWTTGDRWAATERPRFGFGGVKHLYKIQLASNTPAGDSLDEFDPATDFLSQFLVQLDPRLVDSAASPAAAAH